MQGGNLSTTGQRLCGTVDSVDGSDPRPSNFHWFKLPNIEKIMHPSGHIVHYQSEDSVTRLGDFWKFMTIIFITMWDNMWKHYLLSENCCSYFLFQHLAITLVWNKELWLDVASHVISIDQSDWLLVCRTVKIRTSNSLPFCDTSETKKVANFLLDFANFNSAKCRIKESKK